MSTVIEGRSTVQSGAIASLKESGTSGSINADRLPRKGVELRLANRLATSDCRMLRILESLKAPLTTAANVKRLPFAWNVLAELVEAKDQDFVETRLAILLHCLEIIGQPHPDPRVAYDDYATRMQLYAMLPIYLRLDSLDFRTALEESTMIAYQAVSLIDLDHALDSELFELLSESPFLNHPPCIGLQNALDVDLGKLVESFRTNTKTRSTELVTLSENRLSSDRCEGYWSIVQQWTGGAAHLRIPTKLSIGKILWPKVRDHWSRLSQALLQVNDTESEPESKSAAEGFVEIRSANDPQLEKTLDIQLQRCRDEHGSMALVVIKVIEHPDQAQKRPSDHRLPKWQETVIEQLRIATDGQTTRGFICEAGELALIIDDLDKNEVSAVIREILEVASLPHNAASSMVEIPRIPIVCGIACVASPSKRFQIDQLIQSAWRCLDAAKLQGPGAVKSIEVF